MVCGCHLPVVTRHNPSRPLLLTAAVGVGKPTAETAYDIPGMSQ